MLELAIALVMLGAMGLNGLYAWLSFQAPKTAMAKLDERVSVVERELVSAATQIEDKINELEARLAALKPGPEVVERDWHQ